MMIQMKEEEKQEIKVKGKEVKVELKQLKDLLSTLYEA